MFRIGVDGYALLVHRGPMPPMYEEYRKRAVLAEEFDLSAPDGEPSFVAIGTANEWPALIVGQRFNPSGGFNPGVLLVPETKILFVGAGERILAYQLDGPSRLWEDTAEAGLAK